MNMKEFYEKYNLNKYEFGSLAGVGARSLVKYANNEPLREATVDRIEKAISVVEKYNLVRPTLKYGRPNYVICCFDNEYFHREVQKYTEKVKELIREES